MDSDRFRPRFNGFLSGSVRSKNAVILKLLNFGVASRAGKIHLLRLRSLNGDAAQETASVHTGQMLPTGAGESGWFDSPHLNPRSNDWNCETEARAGPVRNGTCERSSVVEPHLAKVTVVSSNLIARSIFKPGLFRQIGFIFYDHEEHED